MSKIFSTLFFSIFLLFTISLISSFVSDYSGVVYAADRTNPPSVDNLHTDILNEVSEMFRTESEKWKDTVKKYANRLFYLLVSISFAWNAITLGLKRAEIGEIFTNLTKFIITVGFFKFLLEGGPTLALTVVHAFSQIGAAGAHLPISPTTDLAQFGPSTIVEVGLEFFYKVESNMGDEWAAIPLNLMLYLICGAFFIFCLYIAIKVLIQMIALWCYVYAGALLLGFGGSKWTQNIAIGYFKGILAAAVKYYVSLFLVALMSALLKKYMDGTPGTALVTIIPTLQMLSLPIIFFFVMNTIPDMIASIAKGWGDFGFGDTNASQILSKMTSTAVPLAARGGAMLAGGTVGAAAGAVKGTAQGSVKGATSGYKMGKNSVDEDALKSTKVSRGAMMSVLGAAGGTAWGAVSGGLKGMYKGGKAGEKMYDDYKKPKNDLSTQSQRDSLTQAIADHKEGKKALDSENNSNKEQASNSKQDSNASNASEKSPQTSQPEQGANASNANEKNPQTSQAEQSSNTNNVSRINSASNSPTSAPVDQTRTDDQKGASEAQMNKNNEEENNNNENNN